MNDYIESLRNEGIYSKKTLVAIRNALMKFIIYAGMTPIANLEKEQSESFTAFMYNLKSESTDTKLEFEYRRKILEYPYRFAPFSYTTGLIDFTRKSGSTRHPAIAEISFYCVQKSVSNITARIRSGICMSLT